MLRFIVPVVAVIACGLAWCAPARAVAPGYARLGLRDLGRANARERIELTVTFRRRNPAELERLLRDQADPASPLRGHYLTPAQFDAYFGPHRAAVAAVTRLFAAHGFQEERAGLPASVERFVGTVAGANALFATDIHDFAQSGHGIRHANVSPARLPAEFARDALAVTGLSNLDFHAAASTGGAVGGARNSPVARPTASHEPRGDRRTAACSPATPANEVDLDQPQAAPDGNVGYGPGTFESDFDFPIERGCGGSGMAIGIVAPSFPLLSDIASYYEYFGVRRSLPPYIVRSTSATASTESADEVTLDIDTASSLAPDSPIVLYELPDYSFASVITAMNDAAVDNAVSVLSLSIADCEGTDGMDTLATDSAAQQLVAQGITVVSGSGDTGYDNCLLETNTISAPASSAYVVAVGGVQPASENGAYKTQTGWAGSGGGESLYIPRPPYQYAARACRGSFRCVPDLALASGSGTYSDASTADQGIFFYLGGDPVIFCGTSLSAPMFAAMQAEVNQFDGHRHGFINPLLYVDEGHAGGGRRDRILAPHVFAGTSWDYVTGLGVPDGLALAQREAF